MGEGNCGNVRIKPLSSNAFVAFFQKIARWWLGGWYAFSDKHPKLAPLIYKIFFFFAFSMGVTVWQFLVMLFLPYLFGTELARVEFIWPAVDLNMSDPETGARLVWAVFNEPMINAAGAMTQSAAEAVVGGGLGNFIAFEIAVFTAQCINFPLQRNITFRSKGNPWYQAMWYFIGWVLISFAVNALVGIVTPFLTLWRIPKFLRDLVKTFITGGVSMIIFFFIFMVIFPDLKKMSEKAAKKVEKLKAAGADRTKIAEAEKAAKELKVRAELDEARKAAISAGNVADSKAVAWDLAVKRVENLTAKGASQEEIAAAKASVEVKYEQALAAAAVKEQADEAYKKLSSNE